MQICQAALLFSCMNTVQFYGFPFMNVTNMVFVCEMHAHFLYMYPHLMVTFKCICHILSNILNPFPDHICVWGFCGGGRGRRGGAEEEKKKKPWLLEWCLYIHIQNDSGGKVNNFGGYSVSKCEKISLYEHVFNSEWLLRERCLNPQT